MDARTQRSLLRLAAILLIGACGVLIISFVPNPTVAAVGVTVASAAGLALEQWLKQSWDTTASPSVSAVNEALETQAPVVEPPK